MRVVARDSTHETVYEMEPCKRTLIVAHALEGCPSEYYYVEFPWTYFSIITYAIPSDYWSQQCKFTRLKMYFAKNKVDFNLDCPWNNLHEINFGWHVSNGGGICMSLPVEHATREVLEKIVIDTFFSSSFDHNASIVIYREKRNYKFGARLSQETINEWSQKGIKEIFIDKV